MCRPRDSQTTGATSLRLSDRRWRRRRRLLLRELVVELVNLARRRRELLRSQAAIQAAAATTAATVASTLVATPSCAAALKENRKIERLHIRKTRSYDPARSSSADSPQRTRESLFCVIFLLFCDQNHSIPWPSNSTSGGAKLELY